MQQGPATIRYLLPYFPEHTMDMAWSNINRMSLDDKMKLFVRMKTELHPHL